jgi:hypothetical protein
MVALASTLAKRANRLQMTGQHTDSGVGWVALATQHNLEVDHSSIYRWIRKFTPQLEAAFRKNKMRPVSKSWRMDETSIKIKGQWTCVYF